MTGGTEYCESGASAFFTRAMPAGAHCSSSTVGACTVQSCAPSDGGVSSGAQDSAGTLTLTGTDAGTLTLNFDAGYPNVVALIALWAGGETLTASATGATVPAFSGKTVLAPNPVTVTTPACNLGSCGTVDRSADFTLSWTGGAATNVVATLSSTKSGATGTVITCTFTSSPGTVPTAALMQLGKSSDGYLDAFSVSAINSTNFTAGSYAVTLRAVSSTNAGGSITTSN
jgi:hypothetical protein